MNWLVLTGIGALVMLWAFAVGVLFKLWLDGITETDPEICERKALEFLGDAHEQGRRR